jgi:hypothetical protein
MGARASLLAGITAAVFLSPLRALWAGDHSPWWASFALWAALLALTLAATAPGRRGADDAD